MNIEIPNYPQPEKQKVTNGLKLNVPVKPTDPVARSLAKPDACMKPATFVNQNSKVRVRPMFNGKRQGRRKGRDYRDVKFY